MKVKAGLLAGAFVFALLGGVAHAYWTDTGDQAYWVGTTTPEGNIYCGVINSATNTNAPGANVEQITDAKAKKDVFCGNTVPSPANVHFAASILAAGTSGVLCNSAGWTGNAYGDYVARAWYYFNTNNGNTPTGCRGGQYFSNYGGASVLAIGASRTGSNQTGWVWQD